MNPAISRFPVPALDTPPFRIRRARRGDSEALASLLRELGHPEGTDTQTVHWVISHPEIEIFVAAVSQALSLKPEDRPQSIDAFLQLMEMTAPR